MADGYRIEKDSLGEMKVPDDALYGAQTQRAVENFPISGQRFGRRFIEALGTIKKAAALVNAELGGVDGAIHRAGGPRVLEECRKIGRCPTGSAVITTGGNLKAKNVIHTVGPIYGDGNSGEADLLASAYRKSLEIAVKNGIRSISFPSISTGAYGYPIKEAAKIALKTVVEFIIDQGKPEIVRFVLFSDRDLRVYEEALRDLMRIKGVT